MGLLIVNYQGQVTPKTYLEKVFESAPAYFGLAVADKDEKGNPIISVMREETVPVIDEIIAMQEAYKENLLVMIFADKPVLQEDYQPFDLIEDKDGKIVVASFATGKYPGFVKTGSTHTEAFHATMEGKGVRENLLAVYDSLGADLDDFSDELKSKVLTNKLNALTTEGAIIVLTAAERVQGFLVGQPNNKEYDWGWISDTLEAAPVEEAKPQTLVERMKKAVTGGATPVITTGPAVETGPKRGTLATDHGAGLVPTTPLAEHFGAEETEMRAPPAHITSNRKLEKWYMETGGFIPVVKTSIRKERPSIPVKKLVRLGNQGNAVAKAAIEKVVEQQPAPAALPASPETPVRRTRDEPIHVPQIPKAQPGMSGDDLVSPDLSQTELNGLSKGILKMPSILKYLDMAQEEIPSPEIVKEMESNRRSLNDQIGLDGGFERWHNMPRKWLMNVAGASRKGVVLLLEEYRFNFLKLLQAHASVLAENAELRKKAGLAPSPIVPASKPAASKSDNTPPAKETATATPATSTANASTVSKTPALAQASSFGNMRIERRRRA